RGLAGNARGLEALRVVEREVALLAGGRADELRREARPRETALEVEVVVEPFTVDQAGVAAAALDVDRDPVAGLGRTLDRHPFGVPLLEVADHFVDALFRDLDRLGLEAHLVVG